jgi:adenylate cyclase
VNLASRVEGLKKLYGTGIMVTGQTAALLGEGYETRQLDAVVVKGATEPTVVYEMLGRVGEVSDGTLARARVYEEALGLYRGRDFKGAASRYETIAQQDPPASILLRRCLEYIATPPDQVWDGVLRLDVK